MYKKIFVHSRLQLYYAIMQASTYIKTYEYIHLYDIAIRSSNAMIRFFVDLHSNRSVNERGKQFVKLVWYDILNGELTSLNLFHLKTFALCEKKLKNVAGKVMAPNGIFFTHVRNIDNHFRSSRTSNSLVVKLPMQLADFWNPKNLNLKIGSSKPAKESISRYSEPICIKLLIPLYVVSLTSVEKSVETAAQN